MFEIEGRVVKPFYHDDLIEVDLEYYAGHVFAHILFKAKSLKAYKKVLSEFHTILDHVKEEGYERLFAYTQNPKFVNKLPGALYLTNFVHEGEYYDVYEWNL